MTNKRAERPAISLSQYLPASHFRTVESFQMSRAASELRVELELKNPFMDRLSFPLPWDGKLYGYARRTPAFESLCSENGFSSKQVRTLYLEDWDTKFLFIIETETEAGRGEISFAVSADEVAELLEHCCRIEPQRKTKQQSE